MLAQVVNYVFTPGTKTIQFLDRLPFDIKFLKAIIHKPTGVKLYVTASETLNYDSWSDTTYTLTLNASVDTTGMSASDPLEIIYESNALTENGAVNVGNAVKKFRDGFVQAAPDTNIWDVVTTNLGTTFADKGGNAVGSSYLKISMCPITANSTYSIVSKQIFNIPSRFIFGVSASQRILGQELEISLVGTDNVSAVENNTTPSDLTISGTIVVASNVGTINFATPHGLHGGDRVILKNNSAKVLNVGPVLVTVVTATQITVPITAANNTYTAGGSVEIVDLAANAKNAVGFLYENTTATQASFFTKRNGASVRNTIATVASTVGNQFNVNPFTDAFISNSQNEIYINMQEVQYISKAPDALVAPANTLRYSQGIPDEEKNYKIRVRAKNLNNISRPVARIVSISKSGATTATVTTDIAHGLAINDTVQIYGVRDQTNFPNLGTAASVASVPTSTTFTVTIGTASTTSSAGGTVCLVNGGVLFPGVLGQVVQSISRTDNILTLVGNATWTGILPGETIHLYGCDATSMGLYDGAYKVLRIATTSLQLESVGGNFTTINCGGAVIKRTDYRIHFLGQLEHTRHIVEMINQNGTADAARALPVFVANTHAVTVTGTLTTVTTVTTVGSVTSSNSAIPGIIADVASAALTTTTTTAALTPTFGSAYTVSIPVTAVTGTTPTLDVSVEESDDTGTNWYKVYDFPRITATGIYRSPQLRLRGNRIRYVQTVTGTTPSFTRSINRLQASTNGVVLFQGIDRSIVPNTLNSTTPSYLIDGCTDVNVLVRCTAQSAAATLTLQFSNDGTNWHTTATTLTTVVGIAHAKVQNEQWTFARLIVTAAGTSVTLGEAIVRARGF